MNLQTNHFTTDRSDQRIAFLHTRDSIIINEDFQPACLDLGYLDGD